MRKKIFILFCVCLLVLPYIASCNYNNEESGSEDVLSENEEGDYSSMPNIVQIEMKDGGKIVIELYPEIAPITVNNFKKLIDQDFYNGLIFHRVMKGFMIQGGDPDGNGTGGPGYTIKGEFNANGVKNSLLHTRGVISMARAMGNDTAGSQFFIVHEDSKHLDGKYAAFGKVIEGMDVVDRIAEVKVDGNDKPFEDQVIKEISFLENYKPTDNSKATDSSEVSESSK